MLDDNDFAHVFSDFNEAYRCAGRAVAVSWSKARVRAEPGIFIYDAKFSAVRATATKIREVDKQKKIQSAKKKKAAGPASRRQPGNKAGTESNKTEGDRFMEPLMQLMKNFGILPTDP